MFRLQLFDLQADKLLQLIVERLHDSIVRGAKHGHNSHYMIKNGREKNLGGTR